MKPKMNLSEEGILAKERDLASGKLLVDGYRIKMMTDEEARYIFGETDNDLVIFPVPRFRGRRGGRPRRGNP